MNLRPEVIVNAWPNNIGCYINLHAVRVNSRYWRLSFKSPDGFTQLTDGYDVDVDALRLLLREIERGEKLYTSSTYGKPAESV